MSQTATAEKVQPGATGSSIPDRTMFEYEVADLVGGNRQEPVIYNGGSPEETRDAMRSIKLGNRRPLLGFVNDDAKARVVLYTNHYGIGTTVLLEPGAGIVVDLSFHTFDDLKHIGLSL